MYDRVSVQYQQALEAARSAEVNAAVNGGLIPNLMAGKARRNANDVAALLASTPRFNDVKIYRDYQFTETDIVLDCRLHSEIQAFDGITRDLLCAKSVTSGQKYSFTAKAEVHPNDSKGNANKGLPEKWAADRFADFFTENVTQISDKAAGVYTESVAKLVANFVAKSQKSLAAEVALAGALPSDASKASRSDWLSDKRISEIHEQIDRSSFEPGAAGSIPSWSETREALMHFVAARISGTNAVLKSALASIDPIQLKLSETQFPHPSEDASIQLAKLSGQQRPQVSASIRAATDSTVTILTDVGSGSGFVVSTNGYIITNDHVIEGANKVLVGSANGRRISAEVIERNTARDLAVLRVKEGAWQPLPIGDIDNLAIGSTVTAIGSPGGLNGAVLEQTVTRGVVSGIRAFASDSNPNIKIEYVQTDAAINRGNSGGPLINEAGQVVGVNTQKIVGKGIEGLNFSISISEVKKLFYRYLD